MNSSYATLQNPAGDASVAAAEFDMMKNINLVIIEHCNLACAHCGTAAPFAKKFTHKAASFFEWLDRLEEARAPFKYISLTGGEPFLHPQVRDGSFIHLLKNRYPSKRVGLTTNFFWASEERIMDYAPIVGMMNGGVGISVYEPIVRKLGGIDKFHALANLLKEVCPNTWITVEDRSHFIEWEFHDEKREVEGPCGTADCFNLKPDGMLTHCSLAIAIQNIPRYAKFLEQSEEALFDLRGLEEPDGRGQLMSWMGKYPLDLCSHCTFWRWQSRPWTSVR